MESSWKLKKRILSKEDPEGEATNQSQPTTKYINKNPNKEDNTKKMKNEINKKKIV